MQVAENSIKNQLLVKLFGCLVFEQVGSLEEMFDVLQKECEIRRVHLVKKCVYRHIAIPGHVEVVRFGIVHQLKHVDDQLLEPAVSIWKVIANCATCIFNWSRTGEYVL